MKNFLSKILYLFIFLHKGQTLVIDGGIYFIFFGSNSSDYKNTTLNYDFESLKNTNYFNMSKPTAIVNHGWIHNIHTSFYVALAEAYLSRGDYNYIAIDWSKYSRDINYADLPPTFNDQAALIVSILIQMQTAGFNLTTFHFIGHSFGAQIFGRVGYQLIQNYNFTPTRITGLDPAGPMFGNFNEWPTSPIALLYPSLNKLNAKFVDIIHTDRYKIGEDYSAGHMDFWPNTGAYQPGCSIFCDTQDYNCLVCSHNRVLRYYTESIQSGSVRKFKSNLCSGCLYDIGLCYGSVASMGFYADKYSANPGNYYLTTNDVSPYSISNV